jgi:tRNA threonylcarbamoyladenosine biosynthesis protein TsaB
MIVTIKTDNPIAEIGLFKDGKRLNYYTWEANRNLAKELLQTIQDLLQAEKADWKDVTGVVAFKGPGSFTGLRIGITTANALAYGRNVPIIGELGEDWLQAGIERVSAGENDRIVLPHYGAEAHITPPKK